MASSPIIQVEGVSKRFGAFLALEDINFTVKKGEIVGFVGLNGAGKSTTINLLLGFLRVSEGQVKVFDQVITPESAHRTHGRIGFASGDMSLFNNLRGDQYLAFLAHRYGLRDDVRLQELCRQFEPQLDKKIGDLSRGNRQKVALIGAFIASPELVILDEPSSGLDPLMQQVFLDLVREEGERGTTIFMSSHYLGEVADVCSRVLLMRKGKLVEDIQSHQLAAAGGKMIRATGSRAITPPKSAESITQQKVGDEYETSFVYKGSSVELQKWLASAPPLSDFSVTEHDLEAAFSDLYAKDAVEAPDA